MVLPLVSKVAVAPVAMLILRLAFRLMLLAVSCSVALPVNWMLL